MTQPIYLAAPMQPGRPIAKPDALWEASSLSHCRSRLHPTIALSSTESKLYFMVDAGKEAIYLRTILEDLGLEQLQPTPIQSDNRGARMLPNAQQPTRRTRQVETQNMAVILWTKEDIKTKSEHNLSDSLSKSNGRIKHHEHFDCLMGRRKPACAPAPTTTYIHKLFCSTYRILNELETPWSLTSSLYFAPNWDFFIHYLHCCCY